MLAIRPRPCLFLMAPFAYIKRIDATIAALKSAGVPAIWVGLPSQRGTNASAAYLNETIPPL